VVGDGLAARRLDLVDDLLRGGVRASLPVDRATQVVHDDQRAALRQFERVRPAETTTCTGDDRHLPIESKISHGLGSYRPTTSTTKSTPRTRSWCRSARCR